MRQGTHGDTFYIISEGQVRVTKRVEGKQNYIENKNRIGVQRLLVMPSKLWKFECSGRGTFGLNEASFWDVSIEWSSGLV